MDERTYGETRDCRGCRYWSEMIAIADEGGLLAMCLNSTSPRHSTYVGPHARCDQWASGHNGAVDDPPNYGEEVRALYAGEEG